MRSRAALLRLVVGTGALTCAAAARPGATAGAEALASEGSAEAATFRGRGWVGKERVRQRRRLVEQPTPLIVHVTHSTPTLSGKLAELWGANMAKLPAGTRLMYYNDSAMTASARDISAALRDAGVVDGAFDAFSSLRPMAFRADLWRYMTLWQHGGLYLDHKVRLASNVTDFVDFSARGAMWLVKDLELRSGLWNAIMAAPPRHSLMERVLRHVVGVVKAREYPTERYPLLAITGPAALAEALGMRGSGTWGHWVIDGFDNLKDPPRIFAEYLPNVGIAQIGHPSHVFATTDDELHSARTSTWYPVFYNKHQVYCEEPGPPCPNH